MTEQKQTMTQRAQGIPADRSESPEDLETMATALEEMQLSLEPVRDQALDRKAFFTGYAQCAEDMIKVIVAKMTYLKNQANKKIEHTNTMQQEAKEAEKRKETTKVSKPNGKSRRRAKSEDSPT
jgi:hypothetical protein